MDRDPDMIHLERLLNKLGEEADFSADVTEYNPHPVDLKGLTVHTADRAGRNYEQTDEAAEKLALNHGFELQKETEVEETTSVEYELPPVKLLAWARYAIINVYRRLFSAVFLANLVAFIWVVVKDRSPLTLVNAASANLLALGLIRQPLVLNVMFGMFGSIPRSAPLRLRRLCAKIYCYGGVHSGCGVAALFWYFGFIVVLTQDYRLEQKTAHDLSQSFNISSALIAMSYVVLVLLFAIIIAAYPKIRFKMHDYFELTHRFSGWVVVILFWPLLILASQAQAQQTGRSLGHILAAFPSFWLLIITTLSIIHPWILLCRVRVYPERISTHAIRLHFYHRTINFGQAMPLAKHPLRDWHGFATFPDHPTVPGRNGTSSKDAGFSCIISKAGDWTSDTIAQPPTHLWVRSVPQYGFGYIMKVFARMVLVTTGSGIGPVLSFLGDPDRAALRVLWQTKSPLKTYGQGIVDLVHQLDDNSVILDTSTTGRVDMLQITLRLVRELDAEAVCVISNPMLTRKLVFECESRNIPAFGPIFDS